MGVSILKIILQISKILRSSAPFQTTLKFDGFPENLQEKENYFQFDYNLLFNISMKKV